VRTTPITGRRRQTAAAAAAAAVAADDGCGFHNGD